MPKMSKEVRFKLPYDQDVESYVQKNYLNKKPGQTFRILSRSLDARGANRGKMPHYHYSVLIDGKETDFFNEQFKSLKPFERPPLIIGAGPAGLFAALRFQEYGIPTIILERGDNTYERMKKIGRYWRYGEFHDDNNVCYGEGGAGLFSDGKLVTRVKSPYVKYVMKKLVQLGAPKEILYDSNPHVGSNKIRQLIKSMGEFLTQNGHQILLNQRVTELLYSADGKQVLGAKTLEGKEYYSDQTLLAVGHSARRMYQHLHSQKVAMQAKDFSIGVRVEHPRSAIDKFQFGPFANDPILGAARYRLSWHDQSNDRGCYSFCMCPGGYVLSSGTRADHLVVNGMSNYGCRSRWSNSAIVVSIKNGIDFNVNQQNELGGLDFQAQVENKAFQLSQEFASGKEVPYQKMYDYLDGKTVADEMIPKNSIPSGVFHYPLFQLLPNAVNKQLQLAFREFDRNMPGYLSKDALMFAPETRTSSPVTIMRDPKSLESISHAGLYPLGEGAGYAGGITSAAVDGVKAAMAILSKERSLEIATK